MENRNANKNIMKDPAVLFYFQDFLVGTEFMTDDEVGKYLQSYEFVDK